MELLHSHNTVTVEPQDEAMETFRKQFKLVAGCQVSADGKLMTYQLKTMAGSNDFLRTANAIIIEEQLPLIARVVSVMKGKEVVGIELRIIFHHIK